MALPHGWVKGQSGNPSGRPKKWREVTRLAQDHSVEAIERLVEIMRNKRAPKLSLKACEILLDRAFGRPPQAITGEAGEGPIRIEVTWQEPERSPLIIDLDPNSSSSIPDSSVMPSSSPIAALAKLLPASTTS
jgi:hypothetical protein